MLKYEDMTRKTEIAHQYFMHKVAFTMGPVELKAAIDKAENIQIIDVRNIESYKKSHIPGAISMPGAELKENLFGLDKKKISVVYCYSQQCHLAAKSAIILAEHGYPVVEMEGGYAAWHEAYHDLSEAA